VASIQIGIIVNGWGRNEDVYSHQIHYSDTNRDIDDVHQLCGIFQSSDARIRHTSNSIVRDIARCSRRRRFICTCARRDIIRSPADFTVMYLGVCPPLAHHFLTLTTKVKDSAFQHDRSQKAQVWRTLCTGHY